MHVSRWGNSLAVRIPAERAAELKLKAGDEVTARVAGPGELVIERKPTRAELIERIKKMGTPFPPDFKFNREEANARR
jgi:antitoxin MazE